MIKPDSLRAALTAAMADLAVEPARMQIHILDGTIVATAVPGLGFEYRYTLELLLLDFAGHPDQVFVPLLAWVFVHQNELLAARDDRGMTFEAERLDNGTIDLAIRLKLTERVTVARREDGGTDVTHHPEPLIDAPYDPPIDGAHLWHLFAGAQEILRWTAPGIITRYPDDQ